MKTLSLYNLSRVVGMATNEEMVKRIEKAKKEKSKFTHIF